MRIEVDGNASKYWAILETEDARGNVHTKSLEQKRKGTAIGNQLQGIVDAVSCLNQSCLLDIYVASDHIAAAWRQGWAAAWQKNNWKNAKGREVRNREQWEALMGLLPRHSARFFEKERL